MDTRGMVSGSEILIQFWNIKSRWFVFEGEAEAEMKAAWTMHEKKM